MRHYTKCDACKKEGTPEWTPSSGPYAQAMQAGSGFWKAPPSWVDYGEHLMCGDCHAKVKAFIATLVSGQF